MSKFGNLFNRFRKKNKKDQESEDEVFFEDIADEDDLDEFEVDENDELNEETIIMDSETAGEELIPHVTSSVPEVPADSDLKFPERPNVSDNLETKEIDPPNVALESEELDPGMSLDDLLDDNNEVNHEHTAEISIPTEELENDTDAFSLTDADLEIPSPESHNEFSATPDERTPQFDTLSDEVSDDIEYEEIGSEDSQLDTEVENVYAQLDEDNTSNETTVLELDDSSLSLKDRLHETKTRIADRFRNLGHKKFNDPTKGYPNSKFSGLKEKIYSVNWANIPKNFFSKSNRSKIHRAFQASLLVTTIYGTSNLIGSILLSGGDYKDLRDTDSLHFDKDKVFGQNELGQIQSAQIFKTDQVKEEPKETKKVNTQELCKEATVASRSGVKLINTVVLQDSVKSIASVQVRTSPLQRIREGETLNNQLKVDRIERLRLIVRNMKTGECESIESDKKAAQKSKPLNIYSRNASLNFKKKVENLKGIETDGNNFKIERDFLKDKMKDISSILTQAKGIQINNPDGTISYKIVQVEPGGVFAYLGIENNDIITEINGEPITDLNTVMNLFGKVTNLSNLNLTVKRGGSEVPLNYSIK